jgi:hypothetical protein
MCSTSFIGYHVLFGGLLMADYYIETASGRKGPYPQEKILEGVKQGKVPTAAKIVHADTGESMRAVDLAKPADSGSYTPTEPYQAQGQHQQQYSQPVRRPLNRPRPSYQQPQQPQYPQQQYPQQQYPQQQYPQQQYGQQYPPPGPQYPQQYGGGYNPYGNQQPVYYATAQTSTLAIVSLVLSGVSLFVCGFLAIGGIICGVMALKECEPNGPKKGRGLALAGIWTGVGVFALTFILFFFIIATSP